MLTRRDIVVKVGGRGDTPAFQLTPPQMQGVIPVYPGSEWKEWTPEKRIETARKLLNEAGYNDDHPLEFDILYSTSEASKKQITAVQSVWVKPPIRFYLVRLCRTRNGKLIWIRARKAISRFRSAAGVPISTIRRACSIS